MVCPGIVTNVTNFGAFVDIGVHQDGLVHISQLADRFVKDPREVVSPGDRVTVRVLEVKLDKNQIALTMKSARAQERPRPERDDRRPAAPAARGDGPGKPPARPAGPGAQDRAAGEDSVQQRLRRAREAAAPLTDRALFVERTTPPRRAGDAAGPGRMDPLTTADSVPVTRGTVPTPWPLCRRHARREGVNRPIPPGPAASPTRSPAARPRTVAHSSSAPIQRLMVPTPGPGTARAGFVL